jgi:virulence-associated protein VagC
VRVPKALELPEGEVYIEPRDGGLFVSTASHGDHPSP